MIINKLEDDLNFLVIGGRPHFFGKWKTTSIFLYIEDELKFLANGRQLQLFINGRQLQTVNTGNNKKQKHAGAELCQAQFKLELRLLFLMLILFLFLYFLY
jgi:hypothetical protein